MISPRNPTQPLYGPASFIAALGTLAAVSGEAPSRAGLRELVELPMPAVPLSAGAGADSRAVLWPLLADSALAITVEALAREFPAATKVAASSSTKPLIIRRPRRTAKRSSRPVGSRVQSHRERLTQTGLTSTPCSTASRTICDTP